MNAILVGGIIYYVIKCFIHKNTSSEGWENVAFQSYICTWSIWKLGEKVFFLSLLQHGKFKYANKLCHFIMEVLHSKNKKKTTRICISFDISLSYKQKKAQQYYQKAQQILWVLRIYGFQWHGWGKAKRFFMAQTLPA